MGAVVQIVSANWRRLSESERDPYDRLAKTDRERYKEECARRDKEVLAEQEERRRNNQMTSTDTRMRNSTLANTEDLAIKDAMREARKPKELTRAQQANKDVRELFARRQRRVVSCSVVLYALMTMIIYGEVFVSYTNRHFDAF